MSVASTWPLNSSEAMAFRVRRDSLNHSPEWYREHLASGEAGAPSTSSALKADMRLLDAEFDPKACYEERVGTYEEAWNAILGGKKGNATVAELGEVLEREGRLNNVADTFTREPFATFDRLIAKHDIPHDAIREFLKWRAKQENARKARKVKDDAEAKRKAFCERLSKKPAVFDDFLDR